MLNHSQRILDYIVSDHLPDTAVIAAVDERAGSLCCVICSTEMASTIRSQLKLLCRQLWSNPPNHGARIVTTVLNNPALRADW